MITLVDGFGFAGLTFLALCWVPQTIATVKAGTVNIRKSFLVLYFMGSVLLLAQAIGLENIPLVLLNCFTTITSGINLFYGYFPRLTA